jgi:transcriptional regulator with XRE-family HTH domain
MALAEKLRELRVRNRKSLQDVATAVEASKAHIWDLETGRAKNPSIELLKKIADYFRVSVAELIGENPQGADESPELVMMYRKLKTLTEDDRKAIQTMMDALNKKKEG